MPTKKALFVSFFLHGPRCYYIITKHEGMNIIKNRRRSACGFRCSSRYHMGGAHDSSIQTTEVLLFVIVPYYYDLLYPLLCCYYYYCIIYSPCLYIISIIIKITLLWWYRYFYYMSCCGGERAWLFLDVYE